MNPFQPAEEEPLSQADLLLLSQHDMDLVSYLMRRVNDVRVDIDKREFSDRSRTVPATTPRSSKSDRCSVY